MSPRAPLHSQSNVLLHRAAELKCLGIWALLQACIRSPGALHACASAFFLPGAYYAAL